MTTPYPPKQTIKPSRLPRAWRAFSLVELLIFVVIISILLAVGMSGFKKFQDRAGGAQCINNLKTLGSATSLYIAEHNGRLPIALEQGTVEGVPATWDGNSVGAWYWNLAPYVDVPRQTTAKKYLGTGTSPKQWIAKPVVFTCPNHGPKEPKPLVFPTTIPVSYAPPTGMSARAPTGNTETTAIYQMHIHDVKGLSKKVWLSDSTQPSILNVSVSRWTRQDDTGWPRISFSRHDGAGNALFFDGHVERIPYASIANEDLSKNVQNLFHPNTEIQ